MSASSFSSFFLSRSDSRCFLRSSLTHDGADLTSFSIGSGACPSKTNSRSSSSSSESVSVGSSEDFSYLVLTLGVFCDICRAPAGALQISLILSGRAVAAYASCGSASSVTAGICLFFRCLKKQYLLTKKEYLIFVDWLGIAIRFGSLQ